MKIIAITRKPHSASYQLRIEQYLPLLQEHGIDVDVERLPKNVRAQKNLFLKAAGYDLVWWHRHLLTRTMQRKLRRQARVLVYDFDDPLYFSSSGQASFTRRWRFAGMLRKADAAFAGSHYLRDLAQPFCNDISIVPMSIEEHTSIPPDSAGTGPKRLLWLGSESTQKYLEQIRPALEMLGQRRSDVELHLVGHYPMQFGDLPVRFEQWSPQVQQQALSNTGIGLCPMPDTPWTRGKCPYKVLQYMNHTMPWVGSAVGENIVMAGTGKEQAQGLCATSSQDWVDAIEYLLDHAVEREMIGRRAHDYISQHHERSVVASSLVSHFKRLTGSS